MPLSSWRLSQGKLAPESQSETLPGKVAVTCQQIARSLQYRYRNRIAIVAWLEESTNKFDAIGAVS
jgi:hypothetical protein